ncbi:hypothetical protein TNCV_4068011 [Trichonephila clavipes]|nr:hypothetical protein TNCV_4068011 [Trichonephila clavipes]
MALISHYEAAPGLLTAGLIIFNHGQVTKPELTPLSPNSTPHRGRGSRVVKVSERGWLCPEFEPSTTKDPPKTRRGFFVPQRESLKGHLERWWHPAESLNTPNDGTDTICEMFCRSAFVAAAAISDAGAAPSGDNCPECLQSCRNWPCFTDWKESIIRF